MTEALEQELEGLPGVPVLYNVVYGGYEYSQTFESFLEHAPVDVPPLYHLAALHFAGIGAYEQHRVTDVGHVLAFGRHVLLERMDPEVRQALLLHACPRVAAATTAAERARQRSREVDVLASWLASFPQPPAGHSASRVAERRPPPSALEPVYCLDGSLGWYDRHHNQCLPSHCTPDVQAQAREHLVRLLVAARQELSACTQQLDGRDQGQLDRDQDRDQGHQDRDQDAGLRRAALACPTAATHDGPMARRLGPLADLACACLQTGRRGRPELHLITVLCSAFQTTEVKLASGACHCSITGSVAGFTALRIDEYDGRERVLVV